jgi:hypothetical protein
VQYDVYRIAAKTGRTLRFANVQALIPLGVDPARYSSFDYTATQAIAAAARFLDFDSLIVPSARSPALHLVIFLESFVLGENLTVRETTPVDWAKWRNVACK